jgi:hypothetical protein
MSDQQPARPLTENEAFVLKQIQDMHGPQNSVDRVVYSGNDEAILVITDRNGIGSMMTVLTNLGNWYADGTISLQVLREWLTPG